MTAQAYPVVIAGGGPVGLTLALTLAHHGVASLLVERNATTTNHPKMDITNGRSMELFRRIGAAEALKAVAVSPNAPFDVSWITTLNGHQLHRFCYPSTSAFAAGIMSQNDGSKPREAPIRASQIMVEPALKRLAERQSLVDVRFGVSLEGFFEEDGHVAVHLRRAHNGLPEIVRCEYLVGCDGGNSSVRQQLGIALSGEESLGERFITHFFSNARDRLQPWGAAWHYQSNRGTLIAQNDWDTWTLLSRLPAGMTAANANPSDLIAQFAGAPIDHRVIVCNAWSPKLLVADAYRAGRIFLAGDAAHQYIPTGGYGMNTGVADSIDLGWKLAAVIRGFGGRGLLDSYELERRTVGLRNVAASAAHNAIRVKIGGLYAEPHLQANDPSGTKARVTVGREIERIGNAENESYGIELGYAYDRSEIVCNSENIRAPVDSLEYEPSTVPGARLPSVFLEDGTASYDLLGPWYSILHFGDPFVNNLVAAAENLGVPMKLVDLSRSDIARTIYEGRSLLIRPDTHIAWRSSEASTSEEAPSILRRIIGLRTAEA